MHRLTRSAAVILVTLLIGLPVRAQVCEGSFQLDSQADVDAFDCTEVTGGLFIYGDIINLDGLSELTSIGQQLAINYTLLTDVSGLASLTSVGWGLRMGWNGSLEDLDGLSNLTSLVGLVLDRNDALTNVGGLAGLTTIKGSVEIRYNAALADLAGLAGVTSIGELWIASNDALTDLDGLASLTSVTWQMHVEDNDALTNVDGLGELDTVGWSLVINSNHMLANVDGLAGVTSIGTALAIHNNGTLSACTAGLSPIITNNGVGGNIIVENNAPGCNSVCEVLETCPVDAEDEATPLITGLSSVHPNPAAGPVSLTYALETPADVCVTVNDVLGRRVAVLTDGPRPAGMHTATWAAQDLPGGVYVVRIEADGEAWTRRVTLIR